MVIGRLSAEYVNQDGFVNKIKINFLTKIFVLHKCYSKLTCISTPILNRLMYNYNNTSSIVTYLYHVSVQHYLFYPTLVI